MEAKKSAYTAKPAFISLLLLIVTYVTVRPVMASILQALEGSLIMIDEPIPHYGTLLGLVTGFFAPPLAAAVVLWRYSRNYKKETMWVCLMSFVRHEKALLNYLRYFVVAVFLLFGFLIVINYFFGEIGGIAEYLLVAKENYGQLFVFIFVFTIVILGPFSEELVFRGVLYEGFRNSWGEIFAAICVYLLFIVVHIQTYWDATLDMWIGLFILSAVMMVVRVRSKGILKSFALHSGVNFVVVLIT